MEYACRESAYNLTQIMLKLMITESPCTDDGFLTKTVILKCQYFLIVPDDWLESKHMLLLMDDTVIMATSREKLQAKLEALKAKADAIGMILHPNQSQYMTVNSVNKEPFLLDDVVINYRVVYVPRCSAIKHEFSGTNLPAYEGQAITHEEIYLFPHEELWCPIYSEDQSVE